MRLGVELVSAGGSTASGAGAMGVYYRGLLRSLSTEPDLDEIVVFAPSWNRRLIPSRPSIVTANCTLLPRTRALRVVYEQTALPWKARARRVDVLLSTCNTRPLLWRKPSVVVLQSLQFMLFPEAFGVLRQAYLSRAVRASLRTADAVIAVSEWERSEAIQTFGLDPARVYSVYHGVPDLIWSSRADIGSGSGALPHRRPYVLMVSTLYSFKNHRRLIEAFARVIRAHATPHELVIAGGDADVESTDLASLADELGIGRRVHFLGAVSHDEIPRLLAGAAAVAYVSRYETFGLPVLEALASGRPLVTSNVGAMAEVAGEAARLVDPEDVDSIAEGLRDVLLDEELRRRLAMAGPLHAASFTWERCARGTVRVLHAAIASHSSP